MYQMPICILQTLSSLTSNEWIFHCCCYCWKPCTPSASLNPCQMIRPVSLLHHRCPRLHPLVIDRPLINNHLRLPMWTGRTIHAPFQFVDPLINEGALQSIANCTVYSSFLDLPSSGCMQFSHNRQPSQSVPWWVSWAWTAMTFLGSDSSLHCLFKSLSSFRVLWIYMPSVSFV